MRGRRNYEGYNETPTLKGMTMSSKMPKHWIAATDPIGVDEEVIIETSATSAPRKLNKKFIAGAALVGVIVIAVIVNAVRSDDEDQDKTSEN